jgi:stage II sporulation protein D
MPTLMRGIIAIAACLALAAPADAATEFLIRGGGYGHGIGMSQYGAYGYALHGKDYRFILAHYYQGTAIGQTDPNQIVRVLLRTGSAAFSGATRAGSKQLKQSVTYTVRALADGSLRLLDQAGKKVGDFPAPLVVTGPAPLLVAGLGSYRGNLEFRPEGSGVETIDALGLDDYVRGVISWEMPASWSMEALKAQAVAARTYAITTSVGGNGYDLYPDTRSQMYGGVSAETASTDAAVAATQGQIVTYQGAPVVTYFFSSSGGHTENVEDVWPGATPDPWLRGVPDPYDGAGGNPYEHWGYNLSLGQASRRLGGLVKGQLIGIQVVKHGASPRIVLADVVGSSGRTQVDGYTLQSAFGLMSTYVAFTTITTLPGPAPQHSRRHAHASIAQVMFALAHGLAATPGIHGTVFPARPRDAIAIQVLGNGGWQTVSHAGLGAGGAYSLQLPVAGRYRIVYRGLNGPAVNVP